MPKYRNFGTATIVCNGCARNITGGEQRLGGGEEGVGRGNADEQLQVVVVAVAKERRRG